MVKFSRKWNLPAAVGIDTGYCTKSYKMVSRNMLLKLGVHKGRIPCPQCGTIVVPEFATEILDCFTYPRHTKPNTSTDVIPTDIPADIEPLF